MSQPESPPNSLAERLEEVRVGLRAELDISRHVFHGVPHYVVQDPITFASHQLTTQDYQVLMALSGQRTLKVAFAALVEQRVLKEDCKEDFYCFVMQLHQLGLLSLPLGDGKALYSRFEEKQNRRKKSWPMKLLFFRLPLLQPDTFLNRTSRFAAPLFTRTCFLLWLLAACVSGFIVFCNWAEFWDPLRTMLALKNLPLMWCLLIGLKVVHEFGHAYACKIFGGRVPEMGINLMLLTPCAYVDASATWHFPSRFRRIVVSLAGMYFESIVAMLALVVWSLTEPSLLHSAAQYAVILSTVITIGFNINPLMKYDGYYVLSDVVNIPNLRQRATSQLLSWFKRVLFGVKTRPAFKSRLTRLSLGLFAIAGASYKLLVVVGISVVIALKMPLVGLAVAGFFLLGTVLQMARQLVRYVRFSPEVAQIRRRVIVTTVCVVGLLPVCLLTIPVSGSTTAVGVVGRQYKESVRVAGDGFVGQMSYQVGDRVQAGHTLCRLDNPQAMFALRRNASEIKLLQIELQQQMDNPVEATAVLQKLIRAKREYQRSAAATKDLDVVAPVAGQITELVDVANEGRYVRKGHRLATVSHGKWVLNSLLDEATWSSCSPSRGDQVTVRLAGHNRNYSGRVVHVAAAGTRHIEETVLTQVGGGQIPVSQASMEATQPFFEVQIEFDHPELAMFREGLTASVTLNGQRAPIAVHLYRKLLHFLGQLSVMR